MNRRAILQLVLVVSLSFCQVSFAQDLNWQTDLEASKSLANSDNKLILLHFSADWCRPCKELEKFVFTSSRVISKINQRLVPVHIDTDMHPELVKQFAVSEIPTDVIITSSGRVITKRKSPKTTDDYVRMIDNLPGTEVASNQENIVLTQKIDQVLAAAKSKQAIQKNNDFLPTGTTPSAPVASKESTLLASAFKSGPSHSPDASQSTNASHSTTKLVAHVDDMSSISDQAGQSESDLPKAVSQSKRVINDTFFVEKSDRAEAQVETHGFAAETKKTQTSTAKINGSFKGSDRMSVIAESNAAKILTPDFGNPVDRVAFDAQQRITKHRTGMVDSASNAGAKSGGMPVAASRAKVLANNIEESGLDSNQLSKQTNLSQSRLGSNSGEKTRIGTAVNQSGFALAGKCPVTLIKEGKWVDGDQRFGCLHRGRLYLFADQSKLETFQKDPESFSPILAGYDPVYFHEKGELVDGEAKHGVFMGKTPNQRIVLFKSIETRAKFQSEPQKFMNTIRLAVENSNTNMK